VYVYNDKQKNSPQKETLNKEALSTSMRKERMDKAQRSPEERRKAGLESMKVLGVHKIQSDMEQTKEIIQPYSSRLRILPTNGSPVS